MRYFLIPLKFFPRLVSNTQNTCLQTTSKLWMVLTYSLLQTHINSSKFGVACLQFFPCQTVLVATVDLDLLATYPLE
jgi:hypothetical protein